MVSKCLSDPELSVLMGESFEDDLTSMDENQAYHRLTTDMGPASGQPLPTQESAHSSLKLVYQTNYCPKKKLLSGGGRVQAHSSVN